MAVVAYDRLRMLWGALDWQHGSNTPYTAAQTSTGGSSAVGPGIGVRRCVAVVDRSTAHASADPAEMHFDFLNITSGAPDDTWTTADFTTLEGYLDTFFGVIASNLWSSGYKLTQYNWYREGAGIVAPNPAVRQITKTTPLAGSNAGTSVHPPQVACSLTQRNGVRRSWGRTYIPVNVATLLSAQTLPTATVDAIANGANALMTSAASSDFYWGTTSKTLSAFLNTEHIEVDDNLDVIRRRRWKSSTYKKILP
jgi:hypothetical protein